MQRSLLVLIDGGLLSADSSSGDSLRLEYPKGLSPSERADAQSRLARLPPELAQQLLDELAARLKVGYRHSSIWQA